MRFYLLGFFMCVSCLYRFFHYRFPLIYPMQNDIKQQHVKVTLLSRITWFGSIQKQHFIDNGLKRTILSMQRISDDNMAHFVPWICEQVKVINNSYVNTFWIGLHCGCIGCLVFVWMFCCCWQITAYICFRFLLIIDQKKTPRWFAFGMW